MKRCIIITAYLDAKISDLIKIDENDFVICADGGFLIAEKNGIKVSCVLGDLDSMENVPKGQKFIKFPKEKDDTDTILCVKYGLQQGYSEFVILGGVGGRLDHTFANIQTLAYLQEKNCFGKIVSNDTEIMLSLPGTLTLAHRENSYFSLFSYSEKCSGVSIKNAKYEVNNTEIKNTFPIGVSNEFLHGDVTISYTDGIMLIMVINK